MPHNIDIMAHRSHDIVKNQGLVTAQPALETQGRLYAIHNPTTSRHVYVGTAGNLQNRFTARINAVRELGFANAEIKPITIYAFRVIVNNQARQPNDQGFAGGFDVEHLLIRLHLAQGINVRNIAKLLHYNNTSGMAINLRLVGTAGLAVPGYLGGAAINAAIANNGFY